MRKLKSKKGVYKSRINELEARRMMSSLSIDLMGEEIERLREEIKREEEKE